MVNQKQANERTDEAVANEELVEISAIKVFDTVRKSVSKINAWPLTPDRIDVHEDAYRSLASDGNDDFGFAHIGIEYTKKYTDLAFGMVFTKYHVGLSIGGQDYVLNPYVLYGNNEKVIAQKLINILVGLSNGQLAILNTVTQEDERIQAWELLYRQPNKQLYDALATYNMFDRKRKLKNIQLTTQKFANTAEIADVEVDIDAYKTFTFETKWLNKFNRTQIAGLHVPLTIEDWERNVDEYYDKKYETGPKKAKDFLRSVDRWSTKGDRTPWQSVLNAVKWRHLEMLWWSVAMMIYPMVIHWSLDDFRPAMIVFGGFVIAATIFRRNEKFYEHFPYIRASAYVGFVLTAILFGLSYDASIWWYILGVCATGSLVECVFFDIYNARHAPGSRE